MASSLPSDRPGIDRILNLGGEPVTNNVLLQFDDERAAKLIAAEKRQRDRIGDKSPIKGADEAILFLLLRISSEA